MMDQRDACQPGYRFSARCNASKHGAPCTVAAFPAPVSVVQIIVRLRRCLVISILKEPPILAAMEARMLVLRSNEASPFVRKVRIVAALLGLEDRIEISPADTNDPGDSLRNQNPLGKIPALILENGEAIFDSAVIVEYLDWLAGGRKVIPSEPEVRFRSLTQQALADGIMEAAVLRRYEALWRPPELRSQKWLDYHDEKITRALAVFEAAPPEELSDVATVALACALGYLDLRFEGAWRAYYPRLVGWLEVFAEATPSFEATRFRG
jgi:glutathione S-transferase